MGLSVTVNLQNLMRDNFANAARSLRYAICKVVRSPFSGRLFRMYAPRVGSKKNYDTASPTIAIVNLIPFLGDTIFYLPLVDALRTANPKARISCICTGSLSQILRNYPGVDEVLCCPGLGSTWLTRIPILRNYCQLFAAYRFCRSVKQTRKFDVALVPRGGEDPFLSAHTAWMMGVPRIYGYSSRLEPERRYMGNGADALMTQMVKVKHYLHESMRALEVAEIAGLVRSEAWSEDQPVKGLQVLADRQNFAEIAQIAGLKPGEQFAVIAPGASIQRRRWPSDRFREIARNLERSAGLAVLVIGSPEEHSIGADVARGLGPQIHNVVGKFSLLQLIGLMRRASLFVGNDSGPGHIAGALGVPVVSLNAYSLEGAEDHHQSPKRNRPVGPRVVVLQPQQFLAPCKEECLSLTLHCLGQIRTEEVWVAIVRALGLKGEDFAENPQHHS